VQAPVDDGRRDGGVAQVIAPGAAAVARQDDAGLEVPLGDDLEDGGGGSAGSAR